MPEKYSSLSGSDRLPGGMHLICRITLPRMTRRLPSANRRGRSAVSAVLVRSGRQAAGRLKAGVDSTGMTLHERGECMRGKHNARRGLPGFTPSQACPTAGYRPLYLPAAAAARAALGICLARLRRLAKVGGGRLSDRTTDAASPSPSPSPCAPFCMLSPRRRCHRSNTRRCLHITA